MSVLKQIESGVRAALADVEGRVLLQVLREQLPTMTFGDLRDLLGTPLGRRLQGFSVVEALRGDDAPAPPRAAPAPAPTTPAVPRAKTAARKSPKAATGEASATRAAERSAGARRPEPAAAPAKAARGEGSDLEPQVRALLQRARGPVRNGELAAALGLSRFRVLAVVQRLVAAGELAALGHPKRPSYVLTGGRAPTATPAPVEATPASPAKATKAATKATKAAKAAKTAKATAAKTAKATTAKTAKTAKTAAAKGTSKAPRAKAAKVKAKAAPAEAPAPAAEVPAAAAEAPAAPDAPPAVASAPAPAPAPTEAPDEATLAASKPAIPADPAFLEQLGLTHEWTLASQLRKGTDLPAHRFTDQMRALLDAGLIERTGNTGQTKYRRAGAAA